MIKQVVKKFSLLQLVSCGFIVLFVFLLVLFSSHILNPTSFKKELSTSYQDKINYQVYLTANNFINPPVLGMDRTYVSSMVDNILIDFREISLYKESKSFYYNYNIYAKLSVNYKEDNEEDGLLFEKVYPLKVVDNQEKVGKTLTIQERVSIPFKNYQNIVNEFKNTYHLGIYSKLDIIMDINYQYEDEKKEKSMSLSIPMNQDVFNISLDYKKNDNSYEKVEISNMNIPCGAIVVILIVLGFIEVILLGLVILKVICIYSISEYERVRNKIKKDYGSIIVDIDNKIDFSKFTIFEIKTIGEMVDLEEELRIPILFYENPKERVSYFVIIKDHYMYRFTLRNNAIEIL